jgi:hypothetical protein
MYISSLEGPTPELQNDSFWIHAPSFCSSPSLLVPSSRHISRPKEPKTSGCRNHVCLPTGSYKEYIILSCFRLAPLDRHGTPHGFVPYFAFPIKSFTLFPYGVSEDVVHSFYVSMLSKSLKTHGQTFTSSTVFPLYKM